MFDADVTALPHNVHLIDDLHCGLPQVIGTYLLIGDEPALVDPGPTSTLANLEAGLATHGLTFHDIRTLLLTHIHLDHAGATGTLVERYPHLRVYVHHRGAPHLIAPDRLVRSAARLYGDAMDQLWGAVLPVHEQNVTVLAGGETLRIGHRTLKVYDAPGHASHHVLYFEEANGAAFAGDTAGVRLPGVPGARPPTPPPDIDIEAWQRTLDTLRSLHPQTLLITHYGPVHEPEAYMADFQARLLNWADIVRLELASGDPEVVQIERFRARVAEPGLTGIAAQRAQQASAIEQSWQGLARYWRKRAEQDQAAR